MKKEDCVNVKDVYVDMAAIEMIELDFGGWSVAISKKKKVAK